MQNNPLCNCIALYDWTPEATDLKGWFHYMEKWANEIGMPWGSIGLTTSRKLLQFKNGQRKLEKTHFDKITDIELMGGVLAPGTNECWKTSAAFSSTKRDCRDVAELCFSNELAPFEMEVLAEFLKDLLKFADFKYGICYQRGFNYGPSLYAAGALGGAELPREEEKKIGNWMRSYSHATTYRTGLLRDVYPFNIFIDTHLTQPVGSGTLESWINADSTHGRLETITDKHWLWSIDLQHIPAAQEALQEAGLLLCYKV